MLNLTPLLYLPVPFPGCGVCVLDGYIWQCYPCEYHHTLHKQYSSGRLHTKENGVKREREGGREGGTHVSEGVWSDDHKEEALHFLIE